MSDEGRVRGEVEELLARIPSVDSRWARFNSWLRRKLNELGWALINYGPPLGVVVLSAGILLCLMLDQAKLAGAIAGVLLIWSVFQLRPKASAKKEERK